MDNSNQRFEKNAPIMFLFHVQNDGTEIVKSSFVIPSGWKDLYGWLTFTFLWKICKQKEVFTKFVW